MDPGAGFFMGAPGAASQKPAGPRGRFAVLQDIYEDPFKWGIIKSVVFFAGGIYTARQLKGFDVLQLVPPPPPGAMF